jgi:hypothetical protein
MSSTFGVLEDLAELLASMAHFTDPDARTSKVEESALSFLHPSCHTKSRGEIGQDFRREPDAEGEPRDRRTCRTEVGKGEGPAAKLWVLARRSFDMSGEMMMMEVKRRMPVDDSNARRIRKRAIT